MELQGNVAGLIKLLGGGEGSTVVVTPIIDSGEHIADISVDGVIYHIYSPEGFSGNYNDLSNKPTLASVATSGSYADLTNKPSINGIILDGNISIISEIEYSLIEKLIGKWIDEKPLYQRTIHIHNESVIDSHRTIANISTDYQVKHFKAIAIELGVVYQLPYVSGNENASIYFRNTGEVEFSIQNTLFRAGSDFYITYEYTKLSDV